MTDIPPDIPPDTPFTQFVHADNGATLTITAFPDGECRIAYEHAGVRLSFGLSTDDLHQVYEAFVAVHLAALLGPATPDE